MHRVRYAGWVFPLGKKDSVGKTPVLASIRNGKLVLAKTVSLRGIIDLTHEQTSVEVLLHSSSSEDGEVHTSSSAVQLHKEGSGNAGSAAETHHIRLSFYTKSGASRSLTLVCSDKGERDEWAAALKASLNTKKPLT